MAHPCRDLRLDAVGCTVTAIAPHDDGAALLLVGWNGVIFRTDLGRKDHHVASRPVLKILVVTQKDFFNTIDPQRTS
jgi:hypothetical protein